MVSKVRTTFEFNTDIKYKIKKLSRYKLRVKTFMLMKNIRNLIILKRRLNKQCEVYTPKVEEVAYGRLIDVKDSYYAYGSKTMLQMFSSVILNQDTTNTASLDLEVSHPRFEVKSATAKISVIIENPYGSSNSIACRISEVTENGEKIISADDMEEQGVYLIKGLLAEMGKYNITFYDAGKKPICGSFSATILIENKPFDLMFKAFSENYETCPYLHLPESLNIPGWLSADTGYTLNQMNRFKVKKDGQNIAFKLRQSSIFKLLIPDEHSGLFSYIALYKISKNKKTKIVETEQDVENSVNIVLEKGDYMINFIFKGVEESKIDEQCVFFDLYLGIIPTNLITNYNSNTNCENKLIDTIQTNTYSPNNILRFTNKADTNLRIKLAESNSNGKFIAELITNPYSDSTYRIKVLKKPNEDDQDNSGDSELIELDVEYIQQENFIWVLFHPEANNEYYLNIKPDAITNYSHCSTITVSFNYEDDEKELSGALATEKNKKDVCPINKHLPSKLRYKGKEHNYVDEFILPEDSSIARTSFKIREKSLMYVQVSPNYKFTNNLIIEVYKDKDFNYRYNHNEHNGILMFSVDASDSPYYLQITFDRTLSKCETYKFSFSIVPRQMYLDEYMTCDNEIDTIPDSIKFDKTSEFNYISQLGYTDKNMNGFNPDKKNKGNLSRTLQFTLNKASQVNILLEYVVTDNYLDVSLEDKDGVISLGTSQQLISQNVDGVATRKTIEMKLKKGNYSLKLVFHKFFKDLLKKTFEFSDANMNNLCFQFNLQLEAVELNIKNEKEKKTKQSTDDDDEDDDDYKSEITKLDKNDLIDDKSNSLLAVEPGSIKNLKLQKSFEVELRFAFELSKDINLKQIAFLTENNNSNNKLYPKKIIKQSKDRLKLVFSPKNMEIKKCYRLNLDSSSGVSDDKIEHLYCTIKCDCNKNSEYTCTKNDKCKCHSPFSGDRCETCETGYQMVNNKCVETKPLCENKTTCNGHGKCKSDNTCTCAPGFKTKVDSKTYCNACVNPGRTYPFCGERKNRSDKDSLIFDWESDCNEGGVTLPESLYDDEDSIQEVDGSLDLLNIYKMKDTEEYTKIKIPEDAIIRVFFLSKEPNRARILILNEKDDQESLAFTDGKDAVESFIAKLDAREEPYYIKFLHLNTKYYSCTRYQVKIVILPIKQVMSGLKCEKDLNIENLDLILPPSSYTLTERDNILFADKAFYIPDQMVMNHKYMSESGNTVSDYTGIGMLSKSGVNEEFVYNIKLSVTTPLMLSANTKYNFLTNDISLLLRDDKGNIVKQGEWIVPEVTDDTEYQENDFTNSFQQLLDIGTYYLAIVQNVPSNHLLQLLYQIDQDNYEKERHCFEFEFHLQSTPINKPDSAISTSKFESMYNRILDVDPENATNLRNDQKLKIVLTFEDSLSSTTKNDKEFIEVFWLESVSSKQILKPTHVYLQGTLAKAFLIIFDENILNKEECYDLKYNLDELVSGSERALVSDKLTHRYCKKSCSCNPHTKFKCDKNGQCKCKEPYTGKDCYECIDGYIMANYKCITKPNCNKTFCSKHGTCINDTMAPRCICNKDYNGAPDCSACTDPNKKYPNCIDLGVSVTTSTDEYKDLAEIDKDIVDIETDGQKLENKCDHTFVPHNLDMFGYLHINGLIHISGKHSLKHFEKKHFSTIFTLKQRSHVKLYLEHSKSTHVVNMFVINHKKELVHSGQVHVGPAGIGSSTILDVYLDPLNDNGEFKHYEITYYIKDIINEDQMVYSYADMKKEDLIDECFNVFIELQINPNTNDISNCFEERLPQLMPTSTISLFDFHTMSFNTMELGLKKFSYLRKGTTTDTTYFTHEYFYVPDYLDQELILDIEVLSSFLNSHVGILLEVIPTPVGKDHRSLTADYLKNLYKDVATPECKIHCFTGVKKLNAIVLSRILPADTFFRIWFYDLPTPGLQKPSEYQKCVQLELKMSINNVKADDKSLLHRKDASLCLASNLPADLSEKQYLGDTKYLKKWGFHLLDSFRIDDTITNGSIHQMKFELSEYSLVRLIVFHGRIDTDLELFRGDYMIAKSNSKNFEDVIVIELPPGKEYKIIFKFYPPAGGFNKCESIRMEFSINQFHTIQENLDRMVARHKNKPVLDTIDIMDHLTTSKDLYATQPKRYNIKILPPFVIDVDDINKYEASLVLAELSFVIEPEDSGKVELVSLVNSDFLYLDAGLYLTELKSKKVVSATHKKNMNLLNTGPLEAGTYSISLRYYRRLHIKDENDATLNRATFAELEFDARFINKSTDVVNILTNVNYIKLKPQNKSTISHDWLCRNSGLPLPKSLNNLRYMEFSKDVHILDTFIVPIMETGEESIKFKLRYVPNMMMRVYVECHSIDIDLELKQGKKVVSKSSSNVHFETISELIKEDVEYEIVLKFKGTTEKFDKCLTFKLEIGLESAHNYACPESSSYAKLNELKPIPDIVPDSKEKGIYRYDSRTAFLGEDKNSGYVYMLRREKDEIIEFTEFTAEEPIDLKIEILNDFLQAPVNLMLTKKGGVDDKRDIYDIASMLARNAFKSVLKDTDVVAFGGIYENRSSLLVKNLPKGTYKIYFYLPGLRTKFIYESRVCSIYDLIVDIKKSKNHFRNQEIVNKAEIKDDNLEIPVRLPLTLDTYNFLSSENYVNYMDNYYLRRNSTNTDREIINNIDFELKEESIVEFFVDHDQYSQKLEVAILDKTHYNTFVTSILKPGKYIASVRLDVPKASDFHYDTLNNLVRFYIGISPIAKVDEVYRYNNMLSTNHQCTSMDFRSVPEAIEKKNKYSVDLFTYSVKDLKNLRIGEFQLNLKSNSNRIVVMIGSDFVLNKLNINIRSEDRSWNTLWSYNVGDIDVIVPQGTYTFEVLLDEMVILNNLDCILFGLDIYVFDLNSGNLFSPMHQLQTKKKKDLLKPKCEGTVLPLELQQTSTNPYHKISDKGEYYLHINKAHYFTSKQITKNLDDVNRVDIKLNQLSLVRVTTTIDEPEEMQIIPKIKLDKNNIKETFHLLTSNKKERNALWLLDPSSVYSLELIQEELEELSPSSANYHCPSYGFDLLINSVSNLLTKLECPTESGKIMEYILPHKFDTAVLSKPYHENIEFSFITEKQYGDNFVQSDSFKGFQYSTEFNIDGDFHLNVEIGYDHLVSLFDIYLSYEDKVIAVGQSFFNKGDEAFPYKRVLSHNLEKGKYILIITENIWDDVYVSIKATGSLCIPFSYSLDLVPQNDKNSPAEIVSIFPPGPLIFKTYDEDLDVKLILSKQSFTRKHLPVTGLKNFMHVVSAIYLLKTPTGKPEAKTTKENKIYPSKVSASEDSKEWFLIFLKDRFEPNFDYKLTMDVNFL